MATSLSSGCVSAGDSGRLRRSRGIGGRWSAASVSGAGAADGDGTVCAVAGVMGPLNISAATTAVSLFIGILLDQREPVFLHRMAILGGAVADAGAADPLEEGSSLSPLLGDEHRIRGSLGTRQAAEQKR